MDRKSKIKNLTVLLGVMLLAAALLGAAVLLRPRVQGDGSEAIITVDGKEYARVPLGEAQDVTVDQGDGKVNIIRIDEDGAVMHASTCDNQLCVQMGEVTVENWQYRANQQFIVCLPNRVTVELAVAE